MRFFSFITQTAQKELVRVQFFTIALPIGVLYSLLTLYLLNYRLLLQTWFGNYPLHYKLTVMIALLEGFRTLLSPFDLLLLITTALLVGVNIMITIFTIQRIKQQGNIAFSVGGVSIIGLATAGCSSCGLTLFSVFGISSAFSFLPFHGIELHLLTVVLLIFSLLYMLKKLHEEIYCKIPTSSQTSYKRRK